jgi:hypothetical protein
VAVSSRRHSTLTALPHVSSALFSATKSFELEQRVSRIETSSNELHQQLATLERCVVGLQAQLDHLLAKSGTVIFRPPHHRPGKKAGD